jgi:mannose-6-phosphate isomerase-like protein (cupin superfamily)
VSDVVDVTRCEPRRVDKPWGHELIWAETGDYVGKLLCVSAGEALSLQYHEVKEESWLVQSGTGRLELGTAGEDELTTIELGPGDSFHFVPHTIHRVTAETDLTIIEVSTPHLEDVVRLEDRYER